MLIRAVGCREAAVKSASIYANNYTCDSACIPALMQKFV